MYGDLWRVGLQCCEECLHHLWAQTCGPAAGGNGEGVTAERGLSGGSGYLPQQADSWTKHCEYAAGGNCRPHTWKTVLSDLNVCSSTSCTLNTFVKPVACYGMEWVARPWTRQDTLLGWRPHWHMLRQVLALPQGKGKTCPSALLQADSGVRTCADDASRPAPIPARNLSAGGQTLLLRLLCWQCQLRRPAPWLNKRGGLVHRPSSARLKYAQASMTY
jgi:hypothetical protein